MGRDKVFWTIVMILAKISADSLEDQAPYTYSFYAPSPGQFNDIFSNGVHANIENTEVTSEVTTLFPDDHVDLIKIPSHFVEFYPELTTIRTTIKPKYILNSTFLKRANKRRKITTTTEDPEEESRDVIPIRKDYQRGVLDLLLPSKRVKSFKGVFDFFRRIMSHTFR